MEQQTTKQNDNRQTKEKSPGINCSCCEIKLEPNNNFLVQKCMHTFCRNCLLEAIEHTVKGPVICPLFYNNTKCQAILLDSEIKQILSKEKFESYEKRLLKETVDKTEGSFMCKNKNCLGWWIIDDAEQANMYSCPVCHQFNCLICAAIHIGMSCKEYNDRKDGLIVDDITKPKVKQYDELLELEKNKIVTNTNAFECEICLGEYNAGEGITLRDCFHVICRDCLSGTITNSNEVEIRCPMPDCENILQQREIKGVLTEPEYELFLKKSLEIGRSKIKHGYQCKTTDCTGWWINDENFNEIVCPICNLENCLQCQAIHPNMKCNEYQDKLFKANDPEAQATKKMLEDLIKNGTAMNCPQCNIIIARTAGCDWLMCTMCKTEICWITKGRRWGPNGNGDISGGCRCRVNGKMCHPKCGNCH